MSEGALSRKELAALALQRFTELLGEPLSTGEEHSEHQWSVKPEGDLPVVNVHLRMDGLQPTLWLFDPHQRDSSVETHPIVDAGKLDRVLADVRRRIGVPAQVAAASRAAPK